jgi:bacitracin synthase 3
METKKKVKIQNIYPLTPMQEGMLFHSLLEKGSSAYFEQAVLSVKGEVNVDLFEKSFNRLIQRYEILRTVFRYEKVDKPVQIVLTEREAQVYVEDLSGLEEKAKEVSVESFIRKDKQKGFDLTRDFLMRISILKTGPSAYKIIWSHHHILMDGWCLGIIIRDFMQCYRSFRNNAPLQLDPVVPYSDYIRWIERQNRKEAESYWKSYLEGYDSTVVFPQKPGYTDGYRQQALEMKLDKELVSRVSSLASGLSVTVNTILQACWGIVLQRYNNTRDTVFGSVVSGRPAALPGVESIVGLFINTLPVRVTSHEGQVFSDLAKDVQQKSAASIPHDYFPLAEIQAHTGQKQELINHIMVFENYPVSEDAKKTDGELTGYVVEDFVMHEQTNYHFNLLVIPGEELLVKFDYNEERYDTGFVRSIARHFRNVIEEVSANPGISVSGIRMLAEDEVGDIFSRFRRNDQPQSTILEVFGRHVAASPDKPAIVFEEQVITYRELDARASRLASLLLSKGLGREQLVAILMERSPEIIVSMLAALKAGGAFLTIDPAYPAKRIGYILDDSAAGIVLTNTDIPVLPRSGREIIDFRKPGAFIESDSELPVLADPPLPGSLAYVIYTSGSTGQPKGVLVEHKGFVNMILDMVHTFGLSNNRVLQFSSASFDASLFETGLALLSGSTLVMIHREVIQDAALFTEFVEKSAVDVLFLPPAYLNSLEGKLPSCVNLLFTGGEAANPVDVASYSLRLKYVNAYGPTEISICASFRIIEPGEAFESLVPIGKPVANLPVYILDSNLSLLPDGVAGEICVGGTGVARGYLNRPGLTAEKFVISPYNTSERLYRTGDLGRWNAKGELEFLGRRDEQVKLRGYRIEPGEIESALLGHPSVQNALVLLRKDARTGDSYLAAYIVASPGCTFSPEAEELKGFLAGSLPEYMVPSRFVMLESFPLTVNGKVDRRALPDPFAGTGNPVSAAPEGKTEIMLSEIWKEVLNRPDIGATDNFFSIGGHSLKAIQLVSRIQKAFGVDLPLREIFNEPTVRGLARYLSARVHNEEEDTPVPVPEQPVYPLSASQRRIFLLSQIQGASVTYNIPVILNVEGFIEKHQLEAAFRKLVERHESLRTSFHLEKGIPVQKVHADFRLSVRYWENTEPDPIIQDFVKPFSLEEAPLLRVGLITLAPDRHILLFDVHHIVFDGISMDIIIREFGELCSGKDLPPVRLQYRDFAVWQERVLTGEKARQQQAYWLARFGDEIPVSGLPLDFPRPEVQKFDGNRLFFSFTPEELMQLKKLASGLDATLYMVMLSAYNILLSRYCGSEDVVVGTPFSGRVHPGLQEVVGMFVNTLALRNKPAGNKSFKAFLGEVRDNCLRDFENSAIPFEELVEKLPLQRDMSRNPLFDTVFAYQSGTEVAAEVEGIRFSQYGFGNRTSKFDLTLEVTELKESLGFSIEYCTHLFREESILRLGQHFKALVQSILADPSARISGLNLLDSNSLKELRSMTGLEAPPEEHTGTVMDRILEQVRLRPDDTAVVFKDQRISYGELDRQSSWIAARLKSEGIEPGSIVGLMAERSGEYIVMLLGILRARAVYLPLDPALPADRIRFMLEDSGARLLLSTLPQEKLAEYGFPVQALCLTSLSFTLTEADSQNLQSTNSPLHHSTNSPIHQFTNSPQDLAYIIYTSGSTGIPKGVEVEHRALLNLVDWHNRFYGVRSGDRAAQYASMSFDASVWEIFPYLAAGASLYIVPQELRLDMPALNGFYEHHRISLGFLPTQVCEQFMQEENTSLRALLTGGDKLKHFRKRKYRLYNNYGPTEYTVVSTSTEVTGDAVNIPIGKPVDNTHVLILDPYLNLQPVGVSGEICVGGYGLARGYLNRAELTQERFIAHPFLKGERLYRSGDLGRYLPNGEIEYLGRMDHQVKIRGHRIELGEIESALLKQEGVREAVVVDRRDESGSAYLAAYVVATEGNPDITMLREQLTSQLPDYMIPSYFVALERLPLTVNGKVDRRSLPDPKEGVSRDNYMAPRSEEERILVEVWEEVLGTRPIGITDNFFSVGGDSIKAIQVSSRLYRHGYRTEIRDIFQHPSIQRLAPFLSAAGSITEQGAVEGESPLTPIQRWFWEQDFQGSHHWNQSLMLYSPEGFHQGHLEKVLNALALHHDALRMVYRRRDTGITQYNRNTEGRLYDLHVEDFRRESSPLNLIQTSATRIQESIDLEEGPLLKAGLFHTREGDHMLLAIHHLVVDGVSWRILLEDLARGYEQSEKGEEIHFQPKTTSFKSWSEKLQKYAETPEVRRELSYWEEVDNTRVEPLRTELRSSEPYGNRVCDGASSSVSLSKESTEKLLKEAHEAYRTEINDLLLTGLGIALEEWTGSGVHLINLEGHGRESILEDADITRTVGWFTTAYPVVLRVDGATEAGERIKQVKESLRRIPNKGIGYGILRYLSEAKLQQRSEISFNYLGQFDQDTNRGRFGTSPAGSGTAVSPESERMYRLDFNSLVSNGQLIITLNYNRHEYSADTIARILDSYAKHLVKLAEHCGSHRETEKTPSDYGDSSLSLHELAGILSREEREIEKIWPLSPMQSGMLFHSMLERHSEAYFEQAVFFAKGEIDAVALEKSFAMLAQRHEVLRTVFAYERLSAPRQLVLREQSYRLGTEDISALSEADKKEHIESYRMSDRRKGFDLFKGPLTRLSLLKVKEGEYRIIWSHHHILIDGWCLGILVKEFLEIYHSLVKGRPLQLEPPVSFGNYISWLGKQDKEEARRYWKNYLAAYEKADAVSKIKNPEPGYLQEIREIRLPLPLSEALSLLAKEREVTLNSVFQLCWGLLLQRYSNSPDVVFGAVVSGRPAGIRGVDKIVGLFINTLPVRIHVSTEAPFAELLGEVHERSVHSSAYSYLPLAEIQACSECRQELVDHILLFTNLPVEKRVGEKEPDEEFAVYDVESFEQTTYNLNLSVEPTPEGIVMRFKYNRNVYDPATIEHTALYFRQMLDQVAENPMVQPSNLRLTGEKEEKLLLESFSRALAGTPVQHSTFNEAFARIASENPLKPAVVAKHITLTYEELDSRSNRIAHCLRHRYGIGPDQLVGVMMDRGVELLAAMLGIIKAGGAYVPIDPSFPEDRVRYITENSGLKLLLVSRDSFRQEGLTSVVLSEELLEGCSGEPVEMVNTSSDLIYTTYTSGSTGRPKGVMIEHRNVVSFAQNLSRTYEMRSDDTLIALTNITFDISVLELLCSLISGLTVVMASAEEISDPFEVLGLMQRNRVTVAQLTPSRLRLLMEVTGDELPAGLRVLLVGGEAMPEELYRKLERSDADVFNVYGPTETTIWSTSLRLRGNKLSIGSPLPGESVYIITAGNQPAPAGIAGEICIGGEGVARGYLGNPSLTAEKFVDNPFVPGERIYRTGDLGMWNADGTIAFLGRADNQVKIRGYRIEPGEIESSILKHPSIKEAVVIARSDSRAESYLSAFLVPRDKHTVSASDLRAHLAALLPEYMMPTYFTFLEALPLNSSGKVNRKALPEEEKAVPVASEPPQGEMEEKIAAIWKQVLETDAVGREDNFFGIGGHSLRMITVITRIQNELGVNVPMNVIFNYPTVKELAAYISYMSTTVLSDLEEPVVLLNRRQERKVFFFPPMVGFSMLYHEMAGMLDSTVYGFTFIEEEDRLEQYTRIILEIQPEGPYVFATYSAGGILTYEMAKEFKKRGLQVSDIILMDCYARKAVQEVSEEERHEAISYMYEGDPEEKPHLKSHYVTNTLKRKVNRYFDFGISTVTEGCIDANVHLIKSPGAETVSGNAFIDREGWRHHTSGQFLEYWGYGGHQEMLEHPHTEKNAALINRILRKVHAGMPAQEPLITETES